jgi:hypothetical protein
LLLSLSGHAATLGWDANQAEDNVTSYLVLTGIVPGLYDYSLETTNTEIDVTAVVADRLQHFFVVIAQNSDGTAPPSNEVAWTPARNLTVTVVVEAAGAVPGLWEFVREYAFSSPASTNQQFFRARLKIE